MIANTTTSLDSNTKQLRALERDRLLKAMSAAHKPTTLREFLHAPIDFLLAHLLLAGMQLYIRIGGLYDEIWSLPTPQPGIMPPKQGLHTKTINDPLALHANKTGSGRSSNIAAGNGVQNLGGNKTFGKNRANKKRNQGTVKDEANNNKITSMDDPLKSAERTCGLVHDIIEKLAIIADDEQFQENYGFSMVQYLQDRENLVKDLRGLEKGLQNKRKNKTKWIKIVAGAANIASGVAIVAGAGVCIATGGLGAPAVLAAYSVVGGATLGFGAAAVGVSGEICTIVWDSQAVNKLNRKMRRVEEHSKTIAGIIDELVSLDQELQSELEKWVITEDGNVDPNLAKKEAFWMFIKDLVSGLKKMVHDSKIVYQGVKLAWSSSNSARQLESIALDLLTADGWMRTVPLGNTASGALQNVAFPGMKLLGITAGSTAAMALTMFGGVLNIGFGIWDVVEGSKNKRSKLEKKINRIAKQTSENTANMVLFVAYAREQVEICVVGNDDEDQP